MSLAQILEEIEQENQEQWEEIRKNKKKLSELEEMLLRSLWLYQKAEIQINRLSKEMKSFKDEMKDFKDEMKDFKDEMKDFKDEMKDFKDEMKGFKDEMLDFKNEMKDFKDEMSDFKTYTQKRIDAVEEMKAELNRKWGELANKMGTLAEDIIAPGLPDVLKRYFNLDIQDMSVRRVKRKNGKRREDDVIAVADGKVFVVDVKSDYNRSKYVEHFLDALNNFYDWYPEYKDKKIVPVIATFNLSEDILNLATKRNCLALQMGGSYLEFLNADKVKI